MVFRFLVLAMVAALSQMAVAQTSVGQIFSSEATVKGAVQLAAGGTRVMTGSSVAAGDATAVLKLDRGGEVRICPRTTISVANSATGRDLMIGMSTGTIETSYTLAASADTIMTPDFRILLAGPGRFNFAIGSDPRGNTCVRALPDNTASVIVSELMGEGVYQFRPDQRLVFHAGRVANPTQTADACGCPVETPVMRAAAPKPVPLPPSPAESQEPPRPAPAAGEVHVQVDAPFVFHADDSAPSPLESGLRLHLAPQRPLEITPLPPPRPELAQTAKQETPLPPPKPQKKKFFGKLRSFFAAIFR